MKRPESVSFPWGKAAPTTLTQECPVSTEMLTLSPAVVVFYRITSENVAERYGVTREKQDSFACSSQHKYDYQDI